MTPGNGQRGGGQKPPPVVYEQQLADEPQWALREGSEHFEGRSAVQDALRRIVQRLEALGVAYAVSGGMALFRHGVRRFTEDVDVLVDRDGLRTIHEQLAGRGYVPLFEGSRGLRDAELGVRIEFLVAGEYPGDGEPKPVAFPSPDTVSQDLDGLRCLTLHALIELKLASGISSPDRLKDLADVQELIKTLGLPANLAEQLDPWVQEKYRELWASSRGGAPEVPST